MERTLAWITAHRRLVRDYEHDPASSTAFVHWTMIRTVARLPLDPRKTTES
ncbi:hypothetical protein FRAHR75_680025 [Frankia sp. Hr75.2]|nr:hypothetical protein FRAHR75_680025 [Frankia sp. Hr75.2]